MEGTADTELRTEITALSAVLTQEARRELAVRYHFDREALSRIGILYEAISPLIRITGCFAVRDGKAFCGVTLGAAPDTLQELYGGAGAVSDAYILECIGNVLLEQAYDRLEDVIFARTGKYVRQREFPGAGAPIAQTAEILRLFLADGADFAVSCNACYQMRPKMSVVYTGTLTEKCAERTVGVCADCPRKDCESRRVSDTARRGGESAAQAKERVSRNYSYGYQRIFGGAGGKDTV